MRKAPAVRLLTLLAALFAAVSIVGFGPAQAQNSQKHSRVIQMNITNHNRCYMSCSRVGNSFPECTTWCCGCYDVGCGCFAHTDM